MPRPSSLSAEDPPRPEDSPIVWFSELLIAIDRGDYSRATESQRQLTRLGWSVQYRKPRQKPPMPRHEAAGPEVGQ